jgi:hypothetical protein
MSSGSSGVEASFAASQSQLAQAGGSEEKRLQSFQDEIRLAIESSFSGDSPLNTALNDAVKKLDLLAQLPKTPEDTKQLDLIRTQLEKIDPQILKTPQERSTWLASLFNPAIHAQTAAEAQKANTHPFRPIPNPFGPKPVHAIGQTKMNMAPHSDNKNDPKDTPDDESIWTKWFKRVNNIFK